MDGFSVGGKERLEKNNKKNKTIYVYILPTNNIQQLDYIWSAVHSSMKHFKQIQYNTIQYNKRE